MFHFNNTYVYVTFGEFSHYALPLSDNDIITYASQHRGDHLGRPACDLQHPDGVISLPKNVNPRSN